MNFKPYFGLYVSYQFIKIILNKRANSISDILRTHHAHMTGDVHYSAKLRFVTTYVNI